MRDGYWPCSVCGKKKKRKKEASMEDWRDYTERKTEAFIADLETEPWEIEDFYRALQMAARAIEERIALAQSDGVVLDDE